MSRKTKTIIGIVLSVIAIAAAIAGVIFITQPQTTSLSPEYYNQDEVFQGIDVAGIENLIAKQKSFAVFVYQPGCRTSENFEEILTKFSNERKITFLKTQFAELKKSNLVEGLKYYPSLVLYRNGKVVTFLRADSDEDVKSYQDLTAFTKWWQQYIK